MKLDYNAVSKKIKSLRIEKDLLQKDIASKLGVSVNTYMEYENNPASIKLDVLVNLSNIFNENLLDIFLHYFDTKCIN